MSEDFSAKFKQVYNEYTTLPKFEPTKNDNKTSSTEKPPFKAYINTNNALGALKVGSYVLSALPIAVGEGANAAYKKFKSLKDKYLYNQQPTNKTITKATNVTQEKVFESGESAEESTSVSTPDPELHNKFHTQPQTRPTTAQAASKHRTPGAAPQLNPLFNAGKSPPPNAANPTTTQATPEARIPKTRTGPRINPLFNAGKAPSTNTSDPQLHDTSHSQNIDYRATAKAIHSESPVPSEVDDAAEYIRGRISELTKSVEYSSEKLPKLVNELLKLGGHTMKDVINDPTALEFFLGNDYLSALAFNEAKASNNTNALNQHLESLATKLIDLEATMIQTAKKLPSDSSKDGKEAIFSNFKDQVTKFVHAHGRTMQEMAANKDVKFILQDNKNLLATLPDTPATDTKKDALDLAQQHASESEDTSDPQLSEDTSDPQLHNTSHSQNIDYLTTAKTIHSESPVPSEVDDAAEYIYNRISELTESVEDSSEELPKLVNELLKLGGHTMKDVINDPTALEFFLADDSLNALAFNEAKASNNTNALNQHLESLATKLLYSEATMMQTAKNLPSDSSTEGKEAIFSNFKDQVTKFVHAHGRTMQEMAANEDVQFILQDNKNLLATLPDTPKPSQAAQTTQTSPQEKTRPADILHSQQSDPIRPTSTQAANSKTAEPQTLNVEMTANNIFEEVVDLILATDDGAVEDEKVKEIIDKELEKSGHTMEQIINDPKARSVFLKIYSLSQFVLDAAKMSGNNEALNAHLESVATRVYERLARFTENAEAFENPTNALKDDLISFVGSQGRSLEEVLSNQEALNIFNQSSELKAALEMFEKEMNAEADPVNVALEARDLAEKHFDENIHLFEKLGLENVKGEQALDQAARMLTIQYHPDKYRGDDKEAKMELYYLADSLRNLIKNGQLDNYIKQLEVMKILKGQ